MSPLLITGALLSVVFSTTKAAVSECGYPEPPVVCIEYGCIRGKSAIGLPNEDHYDAFLGIAFARPPVGDLRFSDPIPNEPWSGQYDATWDRDACIQEVEYRGTPRITGSENCLYLNVYRPANLNESCRLPVMVYIHGGGYQSGSASSTDLGPERFMNTKRVVQVTIQYRLGVFGFLSTGDSAASGNFGMKDQVLALKWVKKNIDRFGGDPNSITIFGQSSGGASVQLHMLSPLSEGLFSKAIVMSGSALAIWSLPLQDPLQVVRSHAKAAGIPSADSASTEKLVEELRKIDAVDLIESLKSLKIWNRYPIIIYRPAVDGEFITDNPENLWSEAKYHKVPWMAGYVPDEGSVSSLSLILNETTFTELSNHARVLLPILLSNGSSLESIDHVKDYYFSNGTSDHWITCSNARNLSNVLGDAWIKYPLIKSIKQYLVHPDNPSVSAYYFNFKGPYSYSYYYTDTLTNFGVCHEDELIYLFRSPSLFPDLQPNEPAYCAAKKWIDVYVDFAYNGYTNTRCTMEKCDILEIKNAGNHTCSANLDELNGFDENMVGFWDKFFKS